MKYLAGFALLATAAVLPLFGTDRAPAARCADFLASSIDEPPPPVDCPFCGGDATAHRLRIRKLVYVDAVWLPDGSPAVHRLPRLHRRLQVRERSADRRLPHLGQVHGEGHFPAVRRHFAVLRCNQCTAAPCVTICPVTALTSAPTASSTSTRTLHRLQGLHAGLPLRRALPERGHGRRREVPLLRAPRRAGPEAGLRSGLPREAIVSGDLHDPASKISPGGRASDRREAARTGHRSQRPLPRHAA
jgi:hypothetical protein